MISIDDVQLTAEHSGVHHQLNIVVAIKKAYANAWEISTVVCFDFHNATTQHMHIARRPINVIQN